MTSRTISVGLTAAVVLGGLGGVGYAYWLHQNELHRQANASNTHAAPRSDIYKNSSSSLRWIRRPIEKTSGRGLQWAPMDELASSEHSHRRTNIKVTRVHVPPPLNLELPSDRSDAADSLDTSTFTRDSAVSAHTDGSAIVDPLVFNLNPNIDDRDTDLADETHLFNKNNGLRGFMAQNWLSRNIGLQGGLAIKENRLREEDSDLRDNVAIGMGVLFAF